MTVLRGPSPAPTYPPHPEGGGTVLRAGRLFLPPMAAGTRPVLHTVVIDVLAVVERDLGAPVLGLSASNASQIARQLSLTRADRTRTVPSSPLELRSIRRPMPQPTSTSGPP